MVCVHRFTCSMFLLFSPLWKNDCFSSRTAKLPRAMPISLWIIQVMSCHRSHINSITIHNQFLFTPQCLLTALPSAKLSCKLKDLDMASAVQSQFSFRSEVVFPMLQSMGCLDRGPSRDTEFAHREDPPLVKAIPSPSVPRCVMKWCYLNMRSTFSFVPTSSKYWTDTIYIIKCIILSK